MQNLSISHIKLPEGDLWLDCGIFFPFFNKQVKTNYQRWAQDVLTIVRSRNVFTTSYVKEEINRIFVRWNPQRRKEAAALYRLIFSEVTVVDVYAEAEGDLSHTDVSLLHRSGGVLLTSDRKLFEQDESSAVLVSLKELEKGFRYQLQTTAKNI